MNSKGVPAPSPCPVCHGLQTIACAPGRDRLFELAEGAFSLLRCGSCGCVYQNPLPAPEALAKFYPKEYWWSDEDPPANRSATFFKKLEKDYREFVTRDHVRFLDNCARRTPGSRKLLLDIGCGNGTFLHIAQSRGFIPHGMDVSARAVEIAQRQYGIPVRQGEIGGNAWEGSRFDFITMFHVLEHLPEPRFALAYARDLLRPGGMLIIQVPNISSLQARLFGRRWYGLDVPRHVINFTPKGLGLLLQEAGFEYHLNSRFSLRDNPASIASSLALEIDPIRRKARRSGSSPMFNGLLEITYLGLCLLALPAAFLESAIGFGGTIWACANSK